MLAEAKARISELEARQELESQNNHELPEKQHYDQVENYSSSSTRQNRDIYTATPPAKRFTLKTQSGNSKFGSKSTSNGSSGSNLKQFISPDQNSTMPRYQNPTFANSGAVSPQGLQRSASAQGYNPNQTYHKFQKQQRNSIVDLHPSNINTPSRKADRGVQRSTNQKVFTPRHPKNAR